MAIATAPLRSSVGLKIIMAVTGGLLALFLVAHMLGNLKIFFGASSFDHYAHWLRTIGVPVLPTSAFLWIQRVGLLVALVGHIWSAGVLTVRARKARPVKYAHRRPVQGSYSARTMRWGGVIIGLFVVYHILDLTIGALNPVGDPSRPYANVVADFAPERWPITLVYTLAIVAVGFHLAHGISSAVRTLGGRRGGHGLAVTVSALLCAGFLSVPFAVLHRVGEMNLYVEGDPIADTTTPDGPIAGRWERRRFTARLVNPANRRRLTVIVVGTGLAGGSAAATLGELGYHVKSYCYQDSPRRAHSIAAQGGINAAKNYRNDGDSVHRLFYDTVKGGDFRSRESNVHRLAEISVEIIDQCVAQGVPFAREYGGLLDTRSFGGAQVSRTFYARGQTGQQLLLGAYQALERQVAAGTVEVHSRHEMLDLVVEDGRARGIVVRDMVTGEVTTEVADAVVLATGGYGNVFHLSTNAKGCNVTATWRAHRKGALFANPCFTQIHPTCIPVSGSHQSKLTLMSESLRNDGRVWVPTKPGDSRRAGDIPEDERDYYLERIYPAFGNLVPRDIASRAAKHVCDEGRGVGPGGLGVYLDFADPIARLGRTAVAARYGNLFEMYERITGEDPYTVPMRIYPAVHYTMGGLWVDYDLQATVPGLFVIGEANFSDHGANRLGASALMQGLADGYFVLPNTIGDYLADGPFPAVAPSTLDDARSVVTDRLAALLAVDGDRTVDSFHRQLGQIMWDHCGMERTDAGLRKAIEQIRALREEFWKRVKVPGSADDLNQSLEKAGRVADFFELAELMCVDALHRTESCGGHFRAESQTDDGEARRDDDHFSYVAAWEFAETGGPVLHREALTFDHVHPTQRSYK